MVDVNVTVEEESLDCELCEISFTTSKALKQHMKIHPGDRNYICDLCAGSFKRLGKLKAHIKKKHADRTAGSIEYSTPRCNTSFMWKHFEKLTSELAQCKFCQTVLRTPGGTTAGPLSHLRRYHLDLKVCDPAVDPQPELSSSSGDLQEDYGTEMEDSIPRKNKSDIWNHFVKLTPECAKCNLCHKIVRTIGGNTNGARSHLKSKHHVVTISSAHHDQAESELLSEPNNMEAHNITETEGSILCKNKYDVWNYFVEITSCMAKCMLCDKEVPITLGNPSELRFHLRTKHLDLTVNDDDPMMSSCSSDLQKYIGRKAEDSVKSRKKSEIWNYFAKVTHELVKCKLCSQIILTPGGRTTEPGIHLRGKHLAVTMTDDPAVSPQPESDVDVLESYLSNPESLGETEVEEDSLPRQKKSLVWNYFVRMTIDVAKCKLCHQEVATTGGSTTGARGHLRRKHLAITFTDRAVADQQGSSSRSSDLPDHIKTELKDPIPRKRRSDMWNHFVELTRESAECKHCNKIVPTSGGSTSAARSHLRRKHRDVTLKDSAAASQQQGLSLYGDDLHTCVKMETGDSMQRKNVSNIWVHFVKLTRESAKCRLCGMTVKTAKGCTSRAHSHLQSKHHIELMIDPAVSTKQKSEFSLYSDNPPVVTVTEASTLNSDIDEPDVWKYYIRVKSELAKCFLCDKEVSTVGGTTSGIRHHLQTKHHDMCSLAAASKQHLSPGIEPSCSYPDQPEDTILNSIVDFLAENLLSLEITESRSFVHLLESLKPSYRAPCRQTIMSRMFAEKKELAFKIKDDIAKKANDVSVITEVWRSLSNETYMSFTATYITPDWTLRNILLDSPIVPEDHTPDNISDELARIAAEWGIEKKLSACVHDGASNVETASIRNDWVDICCAAHTVHLCLTSAMGVHEAADKPIARIIAAASRLVAHFHSNPMATAELLKHQKDTKPNKSALKLIQRCDSRWNSVYYMFKRLIELRWSIVAVLSDREITNQTDAKTLDLDENWNLMKKLLPAMEPLQIVTALLSAETRPSISVCIPMLWGLINNHLSNAASDDEVVRQFKLDVRSELTNRFPLCVENVEHPFVMASVLDPVHKRLKTFPDDVRHATYCLVRTLAASVALPSKDEDDENHSDDTTPTTFAKRQCPGLDYILGNTYDGPKASSTSDVEVDRYLQSDSLTDSTEDVVSWWKRNAKKFPRLAILARRYIAISPTSVGSECVLCLSGRTDKKNRKHLTPEMAACFVFLNKNLHALDE